MRSASKPRSNRERASKQIGPNPDTLHKSLPITGLQACNRPFSAEKQTTRLVSPLPSSTGMAKNVTARSRQHKGVEVACLVRWTLHRSGENVTCQVDVRRNGSTTYEVAVVPQANVEWGIVEEVKSPLAALQRHAEIANRLMESGWSVTRHTSSH